MIVIRPQSSRTLSNGTVIYELMQTAEGMTLVCYGETKPADGLSGFAHGCEWTDVTNSASANCLYTNAGTEASCDFNLANA